VTILDPESVREILSNKFGHYGKPRSSRFGKLLANGLVNHQGEKWAKHRRILNPAFHHEKIKVILAQCFIGKKNLLLNDCIPGFHCFLGLRHIVRRAGY
jgi:hypothetical protein